MTLKVVAWKGSVEVYADDQLMIHQACPAGFAGGVGFVVDEAEAAFHDARLRQTQNNSVSIFAGSTCVRSIRNWWTWPGAGIFRS